MDRKYIKMSLKDNMGWTILSFDQHFPKRQNGLNCLFIKIFLKDNMGSTVLSFG